MIIFLVAIYLFIGFDNAIEGSFESSGRSWAQRGANVFLWPVQLVIGVYNVLWIVNTVQRK